MGIQEGTTGHYIEEAALRLRGVRTEPDDLMLFRAMGIESCDVVSSLFSVMSALDFPIEPEYAPHAYEALVNTASNVLSLQEKNAPISQAYACQQGIFDFDHIGTHHSGKTARMFEVGFLWDEQKNLMIKKVQKHRLGNMFRKGEKHSEEKHTADQLIYSFDRKYARIANLKYSGAHIYALVNAICTLRNIETQRIVFPTWENHPEIRNRVHTLERIREEGSSASFTSAENLMGEVEMLRPLVDFSGMIQAIGVTSVHKYRDGYDAVDLGSVLEKACEIFHLS